MAAPGNETAPANALSTVSGEPLQLGLEDETKKAELIATLLSHHYVPDQPQAIAEAVAADWLDDLKPFPVDVVREACVVWRNSEISTKRRPLPADISISCRQIMADRRPSLPSRKRMDSPEIEAEYQRQREDRERIYREAKEHNDKLARECGFVDFEHAWAYGLVAAMKRHPRYLAKHGLPAPRPLDPSASGLPASTPLDPAPEIVPPGDVPL